MITIGTPVDNLAQGSSTAVDAVTLAQNAGTDNLSRPLTRSVGAGEINGDLQIPGGDIVVQSVNGFPAAGDAYVKIGTAIIKFSYASIVGVTLTDCHSYDEQDYATVDNSEVSLIGGSDDFSATQNSGTDNLAKSSGSAVDNLANTQNAGAGNLAATQNSGIDELTQGASTPVSLTYISQIRHIINSAGNNVVDHLGNQIIVNNKE